MALLFISCTKAPEPLTNQVGPQEKGESYSREQLLWDEHAKLYREAADLYRERKFDEAIKKIEETRYPKFNQIEDAEVDLNIQANRKIAELNCAKSVEVSNQKTRSSSETMKALFAAISQKNRKEIIKLIGCEAFSTSHENFWYPDPMSREAVADDLLKLVKKGSKSYLKKMPELFDRVGFTYVITNETSDIADDVYIGFSTFPPSNNVSKIFQITWGFIQSPSKNKATNSN